MQRLKSKLRNTWCVLRCLAIVASQSMVVVGLSLLRKKNNRTYINQLTQKNAQRILKIVKATYQVDWQEPLHLQENEVYIFMSNHQSLFDLPLIYATMQGSIRPVTKSELFSVPIFGRAMRTGECIPVDRKNSAKRGEFMAYAKEKLTSGIALWIFPEGTRGHGTHLLPFKMGGFHLAKEMAAKIVPVGIVNTKNILPRKKATLVFNQALTMRVGKVIDASQFQGAKAHIDIMHQVRAAIEGLLAEHTIIYQ